MYTPKLLLMCLLVDMSLPGGLQERKMINNASFTIIIRFVYLSFWEAVDLEYIVYIFLINIKEILVSLHSAYISYM